MSTVVVMPGGFHPFHAGHLALYQSAQRAFPDAEVFVAATNDTSARPFPFAVKEKLAQLAGVEPGHFVQVKSPFRADEITSQFDPNTDVLIFVRSEKDSTKPPQAGGVKKDGNPAYLQPLLGAKKLEPFARHAYMAYLPTVEFGPGMTSATEIRTAWPDLNEKRKTALVMSLYPKTQANPKLAATVVKMLDTAMGTELDEFAPAGGGGNIPRGPKTPSRGPWDDSGEDPYQLRRYNRSADFFDQFDSDGVDKQKFDKATGEYEGYYFDRDAASGITQIAYFKFDNPAKIGDNDPGVGWYYEPVDEDVAENQGWAATYEDSDDYIEEKWSQKYKSSINCSNPRGFSQRAHCAGRKKNEAANPAQQAAIAIAMKKDNKKPQTEAQLAEKCWDGYQQQGMKKKGGRQVPNCVPRESAQ